MCGLSPRSCRRPRIRITSFVKSQNRLLWLSGARGPASSASGWEAAGEARGSSEGEERLDGICEEAEVEEEGQASGDEGGAVRARTRRRRGWTRTARTRRTPTHCRGTACRPLAAVVAGRAAAAAEPLALAARPDQGVVPRQDLSESVLLLDDDLLYWWLQRGVNTSSMSNTSLVPHDLSFCLQRWRKEGGRSAGGKSVHVARH